MAHARPFSTFTLQGLSNNIKNISRQNVLTPTIELWNFESPEGLQVPTFGNVNLIFTLASKWGCDRTPLVLRRATGNTNTQNSPRPELGGSHHLPPYSIFCTSPRGPHPNGFLSWDSQVRIPKSPKLGLPCLWSPITL